MTAVGYGRSALPADGSAEDGLGGEGHGYAGRDEPEDPHIGPASATSLASWLEIPHEIATSWQAQRVRISFRMLVGQRPLVYAPI